mmetsp:Transcript_14888/g.51852  ORF Transcript_14888/g.51852 Transcript_14888/m.51852 type:complete len:229 (-) Transcript_14888:419-1105(-)
MPFTRCAASRMTDATSSILACSRSASAAALRPRRSFAPPKSTDTRERSVLPLAASWAATSAANDWPSCTYWCTCRRAAPSPGCDSSSASTKASASQCAGSRTNTPASSRNRVGTATTSRPTSRPHGHHAADAATRAAASPAAAAVEAAAAVVSPAIRAAMPVCGSRASRRRPSNFKRRTPATGSSTCRHSARAALPTPPRAPPSATPRLEGIPPPNTSLLPPPGSPRC